MAKVKRDKYETPLSGRYASKEMLKLFSPQTRVVTWRKLWASLANAEMKLGLPITPDQVEELRANVENIDWEVIDKRERQVRHDVMANIYAFGKVAPLAAGIIHLGATSCYVTDNADIIIYKDALLYIRRELLSVLSNLSVFAEKYKSTPTMGYTHYQPAQLVTIGKRATLWMQDFLSDLEDIDFFLENMRFLGCRGTTGTEASFVELFNGNTNKIDRLNKMLCKDFGFDKIYSVCGQTYPRKSDTRIMNILSSIAQSAYRMANDIRLLQHDRQLEEPWEEKQIGSSAMPYKRNPMRCERICSLSRTIISNVNTAANNASTQWLERTLDDSANRRIFMPESFLTVDGILRLCQNITLGLRVNENIVSKTINLYLPFIATENLLMEAVKKGYDRQEIHEVIRKNSMKAREEMQQGNDCDLLKRLAKDKKFPFDEGELQNLLNPALYIGRCEEQVDNFIARVNPYIKGLIKTEAEITY